MLRAPIFVFALAFAGGCLKDDDNCDRIQADIDRSAGQRGLDGRTVCSSADPQVQKDFGSACAALKECEE